MSDRARSGSDTAGKSAHNGQARPWACGPFQTTAQAAGSEPAITTIQVRLLGEGLDRRLLAATKPGRSVRLGSQQFRIAAAARQLEAASWHGLRRWSGQRAWQVRFITPTFVRSKNRTSPLLTPESIARGLAERWQRLHPQTAPPRPGPGSGPVWVSDIDGHSETQILTRRVKRNGRWRIEEEVITGFVGRIRYVCDQGTDTQAADFHALMAFGAFAGVGAHTTHAFGIAVPEPTWQPPAARTSR